MTAAWVALVLLLVTRLHREHRRSVAAREALWRWVTCAFDDASDRFFESFVRPGPPTPVVKPTLEELQASVAAIDAAYFAMVPTMWLEPSDDAGGEP